MTPESRLDRIERIAKLFARAGRRTRSKVRDQDEKINILINLHIENEQRFARNEERFKENEERFAKNEERSAKLDEKIAIILELQGQNQERFRQNEERFARTDEIFREAQADSDRRFDALIDTIREGRNPTS